MLNIRIRAATTACTHARAATLASPATVWLMMMAPDSSHVPPAQLDQATLDALESALRDYVAIGASSSLPSTLVLLADEARDKHILPEQLLIVLKGLWSSLPEVRAMTDSGQHARLLERVVTMCIKEYYSA